jgi:hypothetical protein
MWHKSYSNYLKGELWLYLEYTAFGSPKVCPCSSIEPLQKRSNRRTWSYVGHKKKQKRWLIYAYAPETDEVLAYVIGNRGIKTVKKLYPLLKNFAIEE